VSHKSKPADHFAARLHIRVGLPLLACVFGLISEPHSLSGPCLELMTFVWAYLITRESPEQAEFYSDPSEDAHL